MLSYSLNWCFFALLVFANFDSLTCLGDLRGLLNLSDFNFNRYFRFRLGCLSFTSLGFLFISGKSIFCSFVVNWFFPTIIKFSLGGLIFVAAPLPEGRFVNSLNLVLPDMFL